MIKRILLENWKAHRSSDFRFDSGTNVLIGPMGSGKTSIMDSICFALFGDFPALNAKRISLEEVIMARPNPMDSAKVLLDFDYAGKEYSVERSIFKRGMNQAKLKENGRLIAGPKVKEVTERIERILEVNYDLFSRAVYSEQNNIDFFLRLTPKQRKDKFDELLDINKYEMARANASTLGNRIKKNFEDRKKWLKEQRERIDVKKIEENKKKLERQEKEVESLHKELEKKEKSRIEEAKNLEELEKKEKEYKAEKDRILGLKAREEEIMKQIRKAKDELKGRKRKDIEEEQKKLEKNVEEFRKNVSELEKEYENLTEARNAVSVQLNTNKNKEKDLEKHYSDLEKLGAECPVCRRELDKKGKAELLEKNKEERKKIEEGNREIKFKFDELGKRIEESRKKKSDFSEKIEKLRQESQKLEFIVRAAMTIDENEKNIEKLRKETVEAEEKIKKLEFDEKALKNVREEAIKLEAETESIKERIKSAKELIKEIYENIKREEEIVKQLGELEVEIARMEKVVNGLTIFVNALKATQAELREELIRAINEAMGDIWQKVYPYGDYLSAKIEIIEGNYEIVVRTRQGRWVRVEGILSGGERMAVAITVRIALSLVLTQNLGWLILDEPTHNLDVNSVESLAQIMREHLPELVEQIFIITHDRLMENAASSKLYILNRDKAADSPSKAEVKVFEEM